MQTSQGGHAMRPMHVQLLDVHGNPVGEAQVAEFASSGNKWVLATPLSFDIGRPVTVAGVRVWPVHEDVGEYHALIPERFNRVGGIYVLTDCERPRCPSFVFVIKPGDDAAIAEAKAAYVQGLIEVEDLEDWLDDVLSHSAAS